MLRSSTLNLLTGDGRVLGFTYQGSAICGTMWHMSEILISYVEPLFPFETYAHMVEPLSEEDGGGYLITFPDLPG